MKKTSFVAAAAVIMAMITMTSFRLLSGSEVTGEKEIKIGNQIWMAENLSVDKFRNGDPIPEAKTAEEWKKAGEEGKPAWCYYDNDPAKGALYGKLYNWHAVADPRGLAPEGWHVPISEDWLALSKSLGGPAIAGKKMKSVDGWKENELSSKGTNESGFNGRAGGTRFGNGEFHQITEASYWWSATVYSGGNARDRMLAYVVPYLENTSVSRENGHYVRCIKN